MIRLLQIRVLFAGMLLFFLLDEPTAVAHSTSATLTECERAAQLRQAADIFRTLAERASWTDKADYNIAIEHFDVMAPSVFSALGLYEAGRLRELLRVLDSAWSQRKQKDIALYSIQVYQFLRVSAVSQAKRCQMPPP